MGWVQDRLQVQAAGGRVFLGGMTPTLTALNGVNLTLANPAESGKKLYVFNIHTYSTVTHAMRIIFNPTTNLPTTARTITNTIIGSSNTSVAELKGNLSASALGGGTVLSFLVALPADSIEAFRDHPIIIPPGNTLGLYCTPLATTVNIDLCWYEDD